MVAVKKIVAATVATMLTVSPLLAASSGARPSVVNLPAVSGAPAPMAMGTRLGGRVERKNELLGAPLFLIFLGGVVITIGAIIIVNQNGSSPQAT